MNISYCDECGENITNRFKIMKSEKVVQNLYLTLLKKQSKNRKWLAYILNLLYLIPIPHSPHIILNCICFCSKECMKKAEKKSNLLLQQS